MDQHSRFFVGLDVSKLKISVAVADGERGGEVRFFGDIPSDPASVSTIVQKLAKRGAKLHFCYEAGPTGYELCHQLTEKLRAKGAGEVIQKLLDDDAVSGSLTTKNLSRFAARRLFERLQQSDAVRELSGRTTFRLFGL